MRLLLYLADRPGQVISAEELLSQVWSGVVVTQDSVYQGIAAVRRALGDDPRNPTYIATVPRLGYRLIAKVSPWDGEASQSAAAQPVTIAPPADSIAGAAISGDPPLTSSRQPLRAGRTAWLFSLGASVIVLAVIAWVIRGQTVNGDETNTTALQSMAVLPFLDLTSAAMDEEYFADGMTEELIDKLSRLPGMRVPSPASSFYFKGKRLPVAQIAKSLGVTYVLSGSVRESEQKLRIAVRLVRADDGYVIWSETYDRNSSDKLLVQDDIATQVAKVLKHSIR
jgi:TolB-like protein/DNA-binding winged helix-turn-helix (wHTH) protein